MGLIGAMCLIGHGGAALAQTAEPVDGQVKKQQPAGDRTGSPPSAEPREPLVALSGEVSLRSYNNVNNFHGEANVHDLALGGHLIARTAELEGFSGALGVYSGQTLGLFDREGGHFNTELTGPTGNRTSLREAYGQYRSSRLVLRAGRQLLQTPFASQDYFTFHPRSFSGVAASYDMAGGAPQETARGAMTLDDRSATLSVMGVRMYSYANRFAPGFTSASEVSGGRSTDGFYGAGVRGNGKAGRVELAAQAWFYDFIDYARMLHGRVSARIGVDRNSEALFEVQALREWNSGDGRAILDLTGSTTRQIDAWLYAGKAGYRVGNVTASAIGTYSPQSPGAFRNGGVLQPYSSVPYTLYTDTLIKGMGELGPGYSYGVNVAFDLLDKRLSSYVTLVRYNARFGYGLDVFTYGAPLGFSGPMPMPNQKSTTVESISVLKLDQVKKGLSASYVFGFFDVENRPNYKHYATPFIINRFLLSFAF